MARMKGLPLLRQLEILKLLQDNPMRTSEIAQYFRPENSDSVDVRTTQRDLQALRDGIEILGTTIRITEETRGHSLKWYRSTVHPLFLALNLTELAALITALQQGSLDPDPEVSSTYRHLLDCVVNQLTEYAKSKLSHLMVVDPEAASVRNRLEEDIYRGNILYLLKSGRTVNITYITKDGNKITRPCRILAYHNGIVRFENLTAKVKLTRPLAEIVVHWDGVDYL
ncbi:MAG: hypothetical protein GX195_07445 [Firmicutes bacterium]|nr:hypothetical protein [Bacillota bacterium]